MFDGIYGYFFGSNDTAQSTANLATDTTKDDWTFVDQMSGRSSPVLVPDLEMQELNDEESIAGDKSVGQQAKRLRNMRKQIATQANKQKVRELLQRRQEVEKKLFEDGSGTSDSSSSITSSPTALLPTLARLDGVKPVIQRKKKCANIKQPKGSKGDNRRPANAK